MNAIHRTMSLATLLGLLLSGTISTGAEGPWTANHLRIATAVEMMKGHLISAVENYKIGKTSLARMHASHPIQEQYDDLPPNFAKEHPALEETLRQSLADLYQEVGSKGNVKAYAKKAEETIVLLNRSLKALVPADALETPTFKVALLARLLEAVADEYGEGLEPGKPVNIEEYQDAFGLFQGAKALALELLNRFEPGDRRRIRSVMASLEAAIPTILPPVPPIPPETVKEKVSALNEVLKRATGQ